MHILVTGAAGFIGAHLSARFCAAGHTVVGMDNLNDYYDPQLKRDRMKALAQPYPGFRFELLDLADAEGLTALFAKEKFTHAVNLAAQAGVRYSLINPQSYVQSNLVGFGNLLECARHNKLEHLVYASSSSVYGMNTTLPFSVHDSVDHPVSLYAATKKSNELMAHSYSHLYGLPTTGLRYFTVYGPWGRPDMALYIFTKAIMAGEPIPVFNQGKMQRDFTYIDDIVEGTFLITSKAPKPNPEWNAASPDPAGSSAPYAVHNIGNNKSEELGHFIDVLEEKLGRKAIRNYLPMQPGDVQATYANIDALKAAVGYTPSTPLETGIARFAEWYKAYHRA